ncbi:Insertion sequence IS21, putative ATP-binding protein [Bifidobacterium pullorum]|uniref:Insertion sequence IS21, putative ATP-binding protein n=1 Tax=Bifidobacterium pullorum TaxID=78448 RepID=A0A7V8HPF6_9BIFI|nr:Insertion sequence IS21, putative ATP-binding protein [Bifidobacterium pullorum]
MTKPGTAQPDTRRRRASTGQLMDGIMGLARRLPLTRQVLADQLETATPAQTGVHARVDERRDRFPGAFQTRATARTGRVPPNQDARRLRPGRPCASPSTTGGRHWNPSTSSSTRRTWPCSALPAPARPTWPSRWPGRPAWRAYRPGSSPPPSSSCDYCAPTRRTGSTGSPPRIGRARLLVVDELGYIPIDEEGSRLLFQVAANAYERQSIVHDRQHRVGGWGRIFGDPNMAAAIIDRTVHHGRMIRFEGDSYRKTHALMQ